jgi:hypothetical protein
MVIMMRMMFRFLLIATAAAVVVVASKVAVGDDPREEESCLRTSVVEDRGYHSRCDIVSFKGYKATLQKSLQQQRLQQTGYHQVPDQKTEICPCNEVANDHTSLLGGQRGQDTVWFVENTATTPVVIAYVDPETGLEVSAVNKKTTPATADPQSVLPVGEWKSIHAFEGDVFVVRELLGGGDGGAPIVMGPVLLKHRVGLIPVGDLTDNDPNKSVAAAGKPPTVRTTPKQAGAREGIRSDLSQVYTWDTCNVVDIGFRNRMGMPLNVFFLHREGEQTCQEFLKFQVGSNEYPTDFAFSPDSSTKFEKSYMGHTFVFRTVGSGVLVETYTLQPTKVRECPGNKKQMVSSGSMTVAEGIAAMASQGNPTNATQSLYEHYREKEANMLDMEDYYSEGRLATVHVGGDSF